MDRQQLGHTAPPRNGSSAASTRSTRRPLLRRLGIAAAGTPTLIAAACGAQGGPAGAPGEVKEPVSIEFAHRWEGVREPLIAQQIESFATLQPNIKINPQLLFCSSGENCLGGMDLGKITTQIAAGTPPDLFMVQSPFAADYAAKGSLKPLNDLARRDKIDLPKTFYPALVTMGTYRGNVIGFPQLSGGDEPYLFMSTAAFQEAGVDPSTPPASWEDLVAMAQRLTKRGAGAGGFERIGFNLPTLFTQWAAKNNAKILSEDGTKVLFNSPEGTDTLQWMFNTAQQLFGTWENRGAFMTANAGQGTGGSRAPFYTNKVGMWASGVWHFFEIKGEKEIHNPSFQYHVGIVPHNAKSAQARLNSLAEVVWLYALPADSKKTDAAFEWLKHITMGEGNRIFVKAQSRPSPAIKINEDPEFSRDNPHWNTVIKKALELMTPLPQTPAWNKIAAAITKMQNDTLNGAKAPREAIAEAAREAQLAIDELKGSS
jgi:multiple sugar transport system substrate-binding protein